MFVVYDFVDVARCDSVDDVVVYLSATTKLTRILAHTDTQLYARTQSRTHTRNQDKWWTAVEQMEQMQLLSYCKCTEYTTQIWCVHVATPGERLKSSARRRSRATRPTHTPHMLEAHTAPHSHTPVAHAQQQQQSHLRHPQQPAAQRTAHSPNIYYVQSCACEHSGRNGERFRKPPPKTTSRRRRRRRRRVRRDFVTKRARRCSAN